MVYFLFLGINFYRKTSLKHCTHRIETLHTSDYIFLKITSKTFSLKSTLRSPSHVITYRLLSDKDPVLMSRLK